MRSRQYLILTPTDAAASPFVDIPIEGSSTWGTPGAASVAVASGATGFYAESRNRPIRVPVKAGSAAAVAVGFVPLFRLGFSLSVESVTPISGAATMVLPRIQCSRSLVGDVLANAAGATTPGDATFQDPSGVPTIRVHNAAAIQGALIRVFLTVSEAEDEDGL